MEVKATLQVGTDNVKTGLLTSALESALQATHQMRSYRIAFELLAQINRPFQTMIADLQLAASLN